MTALHLFFMVLLGLIKIKSRFTLMSVQSYFLMHYIFIAWSVRSTGYNNVAPLNMNSSEDPACDQRKTISTRDIKQKKRFQEEQQAVVRTLEVKKSVDYFSLYHPGRPPHYGSYFPEDPDFKKLPLLPLHSAAFVKLHMLHVLMLPYRIST